MCSWFTGRFYVLIMPRELRRSKSFELDRGQVAEGRVAAVMSNLERGGDTRQGFKDPSDRWEYLKLGLVVPRSPNDQTRGR